MRIFASMTCGHEHVTAEALRLLIRLWVPSCARSGHGPWMLPRAGPSSAGADYGDIQAQLVSVDVAAAARQAKSICLVPAGRSALLPVCCPFIGPHLRRNVAVLPSGFSSKAGFNPSGRQQSCAAPV